MIKYKKGDIVEFWLKKNTSPFPSKTSRWQIAKVVDVIDHVVMIVPWHCGHEMIICETLLKHTTLEKWKRGER